MTRTTSAIRGSGRSRREETTVIGAGYIGLVVAGCLAREGRRVLCVDADRPRVEQLQAGHCPVYEPDLETLIRDGLATGRLSFTTELAEAAGSPVMLICVGTPSRTDGSADVGQVISAAEAIARVVNEDKIIIVKSTVPVGTAERIAEILADGSRYHCDVASVPEFVREGTAIADFVNPARLVVGVRTQGVADQVLSLYEPLIGEQTSVIIMDNRSAELTKYATNAALAARLSLINELAKIADAVGADIDLVRRAVGADPRIGDAYMRPGIGFGGSCLPKDIRALARISSENGIAPHISEAILAVNNEQGAWFVEKVLGHFGGKMEGRRLTAWGLAFKPGTDDIRESVSLSVIEGLLARGASVTVYDPRAMTAARALLENRVVYATDLYASLEDSEAVLVLTEWDEFLHADLTTMLSKMRRPVVFDGRNMYSPTRLRERGFIYYGVGRH